MHRFRRTSLLVVCAGLAALVAQPVPSPEPKDADTAELTRLERVWNDAHLSGNGAALEALWADDVEVAIPRMPVLYKAELVSFARSGRMKFIRYETSDLHIRTYGSSAVVTGRLQRKRAMGDREVDDDWRFTKVYVRNSGGWRLVAFHASEAAAP